MTWLAPIWLWLLLPWAMACAWSGRGGTRTIRVPFLTIWPAAPPVQGPHRRPPPLWVVLLLLAALLAILAAAGPAVVRAAPRLTVVIARGPSLGDDRLRSAVARLAISAGTRLRVVPVPGEAFDAVGGIDVGRLRRTALASDAAVRQAARRGPGPVVVIADRAIDLPAGVAVVGPARPLVNAGLDLFAVRPAGADAAPHRAEMHRAAAQAMVRVFNATDRRRATLRVDAVRRAIDLPPAGQSGDYFLDLPALAETADAELLAEDGGRWVDDVSGDDRAYLARVAAPARVEPGVALPDALARMVAVYNRRRAAGAGETTIAVDDAETALPSAPAVLLAGRFAAPPADGGAGETLSIDTDHPVTRAANLDGLSVAERSPGRPAGDGWRTLAHVGDTPLLAVRETPARQVWVGVDTTVVSTRVDYVVFWTDVFDWLAGGRTVYTAEAVRGGQTAVRVADAVLDASPGLYRADGRTVATAMPAVRAGLPAGASTPGPVAALATVAVPVGQWLLLGALGLLAGGLVLGRRLTGFSPKRSMTGRFDAS